MEDTNADTRRCGCCAHFRNDAAYIEEAMPGLITMSSGHASVRDQDGLCLRHDRYLSATASCAQFTLHRGTARDPYAS